MEVQTRGSQLEAEEPWPAAVSGRMAAALLLPDLRIRNFRGIEDLSIERLGRVTLLAGRNGVGKTTVLEAVQAYAASGSMDELAHILRRREEYVAVTDEDNVTRLHLDYSALFHGRTPLRDRPIKIGTGTGNHTLGIPCGSS